ncbi:MAG: hypothetical protein ACYDCC_01420 [Actinomycetota bacterium]
MRKLARLTIVSVIALGLFATLGSPAAFAGVGGGTVAGTVTTLPGFGACPTSNPNCTTLQTSIVFGGIVISGAFTSDDMLHQWVGTVSTGKNDTVTATDLPPGGSLATDMGRVNAFSVYPSATVAGHLTSGSCSGTYQRVGSIVVVPLSCQFALDGTAINSHSTINVVAQFTPTSGDGVTTAITAAQFDGVYVGTP